MKTKRTMSNFSPGVLQNLNSYVLAAGAASVGLLCSPQTSEAKVVFTPVNVVIHPNVSYNLDLTNSGTTDFTISATSSFLACATNMRAYEIPAAGNLVESSVGYPAALPKGARIGPGQQFVGQQGILALYLFSPVLGCHENIYGKWVGATNQYLGLKFRIQGKVHYGWARMSVSSPLFAGIEVTLTGYAYETVAGRSIISGNRVSSDDSEDDPRSSPGSVGYENPRVSLNSPSQVPPEPPSLGLLARGVEGLPLWRRKDEE